MKNTFSESEGKCQKFLHGHTVTYQDAPAQNVNSNYSQLWKTEGLRD